MSAKSFELHKFIHQKTSFFLNSKTKDKINFQLKEIKEYLECIEMPDNSLIKPSSECLEIFNKISNENFEDFKVKFESPYKLNLIGSYLLDSFTLHNKEISIDIAVDMPNKFLMKNDLKNYNYFFKRFVYSEFLLQHLNRKFKTQMGYFHGDRRKPIIQIKINLRDIPPLRVNLIPTFNLQYFGISKISSAISKMEIPNDLKDFNGYNRAEYESAVIEDSQMHSHFVYMYKSFTKSPNLKNAVILFKKIIEKNKLFGGDDCFNGFHFSMLMAHLVENNKVKHDDSTICLFFKGIKFLLDPKHDLCTKGHSLTSNKKSDLEISKTQFPVVLVGNNGLINITSRVTTSSYKTLKYFMGKLMNLYDKRKDKIAKNDQILYKILTESSTKRVKRFFTEYNFLLKIGPIDGSTESAAEKIFDILTKAFGNRIKLLTRIRNGKNANKTDHILFGVITATNYKNSIELGPSFDSEKCDEFKSFWENETQLRRFKDGSILETMNWKKYITKDNENVLETIAKFVLTRKLKGVLINAKIEFLEVENLTEID